MRMHKIANSRRAGFYQYLRKRKYLIGLTKLNVFWNSATSMDHNLMLRDLQKYLPQNTPSVYWDYLNQLLSFLRPLTIKYISVQIKDFKKTELPKYLRSIKRLRRGVLCSLCNWHNH